MSQAPASLATNVVAEAPAPGLAAALRSGAGEQEGRPPPAVPLVRAAWVADILRQFEGPLLSYATRLTGDPHQACDVVQDVFMRLLEQDAAQIRGREAAWLYTVCRNRAMDVHRRRRPTRAEPHMETNTLSTHDGTATQDGVDMHKGVASYTGSGDLRRSPNAGAHERSVRDADPVERAARVESAARVRAALEHLPQRQQEVVSLRFQAELSYKDIAEVTGLSVTNVGYLIHTAVQALRLRLREE